MCVFDITIDEYWIDKSPGSDYLCNVLLVDRSEEAKGMELQSRNGVCCGGGDSWTCSSQESSKFESTWRGESREFLF